MGKTTGEQVAASAGHAQSLANALKLSEPGKARQPGRSDGRPASLWTRIALVNQRSTWDYNTVAER
jgi:hypothetical protein